MDELKPWVPTKQELVEHLASIRNLGSVEMNAANKRFWQHFIALSPKHG